MSRKSKSNRRSGHVAHARPGDRRPQNWIHGTHAVLAALANPDRRCNRLVLTSEAAHRLGASLDLVLARAERKLSPEFAERRAVEALAPGAVHQGIALEAEPLPELYVTDLVARTHNKRRALIVALDQVSDPHNVGAILRSAALFGADGMLITERHAPAATAALAKAAAGALDRVPVAREVNLVRALLALKEAGFWCAGLDGSAERPIDDARQFERCVLVLGGEGAGIRRLTRETCDMLLRIPMPARRAAADTGLESLNVSNAAAVALYALTRS